MERIFDIMLHAADRFPEKTAFAGKVRGKWHEYSFSQYVNEANKISHKLLELGVKPGEVVVTICSNRPHWNFIDMGVLQLGVVHTPIFTTFNENDFLHVINDCQAKVIIASSDLVLKQLKSNHDRMPSVQTILSVDENDLGTACLQSLSNPSVNQLEIIEKRRKAVKPSDVASIYYSSGTYWNPMGAVVQHQAIVAQTISFSKDYELSAEDKAVSFLPLCHAYERSHTYAYQYCGVSTYYTEGGLKLFDVINELKPTIFTAVPVVVEQLFQASSSKGGTGLNGLAQEAKQFAYRYQPETEMEVPQEFQEVYAEWVKLLGGRLRILSSAGAALPERLSRAFWAMGINLLESYGLTETQLVAINSLKRGARCGTVGPSQENVEVRIDESGEILCKSKYMMLCYHNSPEETKKNLSEDGWFKTGDIGEWIDHKFLSIKGRKKVLFKASNGSYISPESVEGALRKSDFIFQALVYGDRGKVCAIIVPTESKLSGKTTTELENIIWKEVEQLYNDFASEPERIVTLSLVSIPWTIEGGDLTPNMKLRRRVIMGGLRKELSNE